MVWLSGLVCSPYTLIAEVDEIVDGIAHENRRNWSGATPFRAPPRCERRSRLASPCDRTLHPQSFRASTGRRSGRSAQAQAFSRPSMSSSWSSSGASIRPYATMWERPTSLRYCSAVRMTSLSFRAAIPLASHLLRRGVGAKCVTCSPLSTMRSQRDLGLSIWRICSLKLNKITKSLIAISASDTKIKCELIRAIHERLLDNHLVMHGAFTVPEDLQQQISENDVGGGGAGRLREMATQ